jgi:mannan endo-1,4-beta-mannosidase
MVGCLLAGVTLAACGTAPRVRLAPAAMPRARGFVVRRGRCLVRDGVPLRLAGSSAFHLQEEAAREALGQISSRGRLDATLDAATRAGLGVLRVAGFNDGARDAAAIQIAPGVLAEDGLAGLDRVVAEAGRRGLLLVVVVANYWDDYGGAAQYLRWHGLPAGERQRVFTDAGIWRTMQDYATRLATRVNRVTGVRYADDPAILAWEVMNEPRGEGLTDRGEVLAAFVDAMARAIHRAAPRHLVFAGDEGFDADGRGYDVGFWDAVASGRLVGPARHESFRALVADPAIDAATVHWYPEAWGVARGREVEAGVRWIREHARIAAEAGKPLLVEEFGLHEDGLPLAARRAAYDVWFEAARVEANVAAVMPWGLSDAPGGGDGFAWGARGLDEDPYAARVRRWSTVLRQGALEGCD